MRQSKKEIKDRTVIIELLSTCHVGRMGTIGRDGFPVIKPVNFVFFDEKIYFHSALAGEKIEDIARDNRVCFEVDLPIALVRAKNQPCEASYLYRSVILKGAAALVENKDERLDAFRALMKKYQPEGGYGEYLDEKLAITGIVRIEIQEMTGKEDLGKGELREQVLQALEKGKTLPLDLQRR